jgi:hypothetical protein
MAERGQKKKKKPAKPKALKEPTLGQIIDSPYFVKKREHAKKTLEKYGIPEDFKDKDTD